MPGETATAQLGLPDVLFFALFLGAADRFGLRVRPTWLACTLSFGADARDRGRRRHHAACRRCRFSRAAFVLANADLLWAVRRLPPSCGTPVLETGQRVNSATVSTCGVCGNMSTGRARSSR